MNCSPAIASRSSAKILDLKYQIIAEFPGLELFLTSPAACMFTSHPITNHRHTSCRQPISIWLLTSFAGTGLYAPSTLAAGAAFSGGTIAGGAYPGGTLASAYGGTTTIAGGAYTPGTISGGSYSPRGSIDGNYLTIYSLPVENPGFHPC